MQDFIELTYKATGKKFFINAEMLSNFEENIEDGGSFVFMMPHMMSEIESSDSWTAPYAEKVAEEVWEILEKVRK